MLHFAFSSNALLTFQICFKCFVVTELWKLKACRYFFLKDRGTSAHCLHCLAPSLSTSTTDTEYSRFFLFVDWKNAKIPRLWTFVFCHKLDAVLWKKNDILNLSVYCAYSPVTIQWMCVCKTAKAEDTCMQKMPLRLSIIHPWHQEKKKDKHKIMIWNSTFMITDTLTLK